MEKIITIIIMLVGFVNATVAQHVNVHGQKVVKEIIVSYFNKEGIKIPREHYVYDYDRNYNLTGITRQCNECDTPVWVTLDSIRKKDGKITRKSYHYDRQNISRRSDGYEYTYSLDDGGQVTKVVALEIMESYRTKFNYNFYYSLDPATHTKRLIKYDWDEWWYPYEDKKWYRQCYPNIRVVDYGEGLWINRQVDETPQESINKKVKYLDYSMPNDLNIDMSSLLCDKFKFYTSFTCEQMTEWIPIRPDFLPLDKVGFPNKYAPFEYVRDNNGNVVEIKGYYNDGDSKNKRLRQDLSVEIEYF